MLTAGEIVGVKPGGPFSALPASLPVFQEVAWDAPIDAGGGPPGSDRRLVARLDWSISNRASAFVRYAWQGVDHPAGFDSTTPYDGFDTPETDQRHNVLASLTYVFSPRWTSQTKVVYNYLSTETPWASGPTPPPSTWAAAPSTRRREISTIFPGYLVIGPFGGPQKLLQIYEDVNTVSGRHDLRFGGSFDRVIDDRALGFYSNPYESLGITRGQSLDNLMLGYVQEFVGAADPQDKYPGDVVTLPLDAPDFTRHNRYTEWALYANDTWSVSARLKLNLGLRYERYGVQKNADPSLDSNFYYGAGANIYEQIRNGRVWPALESPVGGLWRPDHNDFAPRVGFAWDVTGDGKTSLRAGYGIGYERNFGNVTYNVAFNPPHYAVMSLQSGVDIPQSENLITTDVRGPLAGTGSTVLPATSLRQLDENLRTAYAHFWSASLQREVFSSNFAEMTYAGSKGVSLYSISNTNRPGSGPVYLGDPPGLGRLNSQYSDINSRGNGGQLHLQRADARLGRAPDRRVRPPADRALHPRLREGRPELDLQ